MRFGVTARVVGQFFFPPYPLCQVLVVIIRSAADMMLFTTPWEAAKANRRASTRIHLQRPSMHIHCTIRA